jgi:hypothetical protein
MPGCTQEMGCGIPRAAQIAQVDGNYGIVFVPKGAPVVVFDFIIDNGAVIEISLIADRQSVGALDLKF